MMLDVDFVPCTDFRSFIKRNLKDHLLGLAVNHADTRKLMERFIQGNLAFVVPAFEYAKQEDGMDPDTFPRDKAVSSFVLVADRPYLTILQELLSLVHAEPPRITPFHAAWARGHQSTNYTKYYSIPPNSGQAYQVVRHDNAYEPYTIFSNKAVWCVLHILLQQRADRGVAGVMNGLSDMAQIKQHAFSKCRSVEWNFTFLPTIS